MGIDAAGGAPRAFAAHAAFDWSGQQGQYQRGIAGAWAEGGKVALIEPGDRLSCMGPAASTPAPDGVFAGRWSRPMVAAWLTELARRRSDVLIGIDISAGLPFLDRGAFFPDWGASPDDAVSLWSMVDRMSADDPHLGAHGFVSHAEARRYFRRPGALGDRYGAARAGRLRVTEVASRDQGLANPYSTLNLVGAAQVGLASLSAMRMFAGLRGIVPVWPFDPVPATGPMIVEIYAALAGLAGGLPRGRTKVRDGATLRSVIARLGHDFARTEGPVDDHVGDAMMTAAWLVRAARDGGLWQPGGMTAEVARTEGWTFGVA